MLRSTIFESYSISYFLCVFVPLRETSPVADAYGSSPSTDVGGSPYCTTVFAIRSAMRASARLAVFFAQDARAECSALSCLARRR